MRTLAVLALLSTAALGQATRCEATCVRLLGHRPECNACITNPDNRGGWLDQLATIPPGAFESDDWQVRWGALSREGELLHHTAIERLENAITSSSGLARVRACETAVHVAGVDHRPLKAFLQPASVRACNDPAVRSSIENTTFSLDYSDGPEALLHGSVAWELTPVRLVLDALRSRPTAIDQQACELLVLVAMSRGKVIGRELLDHATAADTDQVNRLLVCFSRMRDDARPRLRDPSIDVRLATISQLRWLSPMSEPELTLASSDESWRVRSAAVSALADGEGMSIADATRGRLFGAERANVEVAVRWLTVLQELGSPGCREVALAAWRDVRQPELVRATAFEAAVSCGGVTSDEVVMTSGSGHHLEKLAGTRGLRLLKPSRNVSASIERALGAQAPDVLAAALRAVAAHQLSSLTGRVDELRTHADPTVRSEALLAMAAIMPMAGRGRALDALVHDGDEEVRCAAVRALSSLGGPAALAALKTSSRTDASAKVRAAAVEAFQKLGGR